MNKLSDFLRTVTERPEQVAATESDGRFSPFWVNNPELLQVQGRRLCTEVRAAYEDRTRRLTADRLRDFYNMVIQDPAASLPFVTTYNGQPASWFIPDALHTGYWMTVGHALIDEDDAALSGFLWRAAPRAAPPRAGEGPLGSHPGLAPGLSPEVRNLVRVARAFGADSELAVAAIKRWIIRLEERNGRVRTGPAGDLPFP
jgi:hypothetical protein